MRHSLNPYKRGEATKEKVQHSLAAFPRKLFQRKLTHTHIHSSSHTKGLLSFFRIFIGVKMGVRSLVYCFLWISSIICGFFLLYAPLLPLVVLKRDWYREATNKLFTIWEVFNVVSE